jgi:long-subunit acyl-CoA synthetase (AMP-forming)
MNQKSQKGLTTIGWIVVIAIFGSIILTGFKILPMYLEYYQVRSVLENVAANPEVDARSKKAIWSAITRQFLINQIRDIKRENMKVERENDITKITIDYEVRKPYVAQLFIGGHFTYTVEKKE